MTKVLIVEDSRTFSSLLARAVSRELGFQAVIAPRMAQARELLEQDPGFMAALLDINLPDAPEGEVVDLVIDHGVPAVIFTGEMEDGLRERFWGKRIVDYVFKSSRENVSHVISLLKRLHRNPGISVLVVDDSRLSRTSLSTLLRTHRFNVLEAADGREGLAFLESHPDIRLVITDYTMPEMDGFELTREIRRTRGRDQVAIIGVSSSTGSSLTARFLKNGANDFLHKPFGSEEFYARVNQNIETLEHIAEIRELADKDFLTKLFNRRYFFSTGEEAFAAAVAAGRPRALAMLDIDHFKQVNDTNGHEAGDAVLRHLAGVLGEHFGSESIVARFGGEEFCVLILHQDEAAALASLDALRRRVEAGPVPFGDGYIAYTVSLGLCCQGQGSLDNWIKAADGALYESKRNGRNRVTLARPD